MREILDARGPGYRPPESGLEARVQDLARSIGLLTLARQVSVGDDEPIGRVDFCDSESPLVIEVDSEIYHGSIVDLEADRRRDDRLREAGFVVERVLEFDVWHRPDDVRRQLRSARRRARNGNTRR